jgi:hypothetical protein
MRHIMLCVFIFRRWIELRIRLQRNRLTGPLQSLPQLLGQEWHQRMQQSQRGFVDVDQVRGVSLRSAAS